MFALVYLSIQCPKSPREAGLFNAGRNRAALERSGKAGPGLRAC